jgi:hypothetical protein
MPFLEHLKQAYPKIADKIQRDALNTRGAPWPENKAQRRNRQPRWTLKKGDQLYPQHYAEYDTCLEVARQLTLQVYEMDDAPDCPPQIVTYLGRQPTQGAYVCPICRLPIHVADFALARQSKAQIETAHVDPSSEALHTPENVCFAHRECNIAQGERTVNGFLEWMQGILERHGYSVRPLSEG